MGSDVSYEELEDKVVRVLEENPHITVELSNLSRGPYERLTGIFEVNYDVRGIINILNVGDGNRENYALHVRRRGNA